MCVFKHQSDTGEKNALENVCLLYHYVFSVFFFLIIFFFSFFTTLTYVVLRVIHKLKVW